MTRQTYSRPFGGDKATMDSFRMLHTFETTMNNVKRMIEKESVYSPWIKIQFGNRDPIVFNTASQDPEQNIIANLEIHNTGAGVVNDFSLKVFWDPFNSGQNSQAQIQGLDEIIGMALEGEIDPLMDYEEISGKIQYGYNIVGDELLVSPLYKFILTKADASIEWTTGMVSYTFEGSTILGLDCDFTDATFEYVEDCNLMDLIGGILYYYYGDPNNPPPNQNIAVGTPTYKNPLGYKIDIPKEYYTQCLPKVTVNAVQGEKTPWQYCQDVLNRDKDTRMLEQDKTVKEYMDNWETVKDYEKPYWYLYVTDSDKTIHVVHSSPKLSKDNDIKNEEGLTLYLSEPITWGLKQTSLVVKWHSSIDLYYYLISRMSLRRKVTQQMIDEAQQKYNEAEIIRDEYVSQMNNETAQQQLIYQPKYTRDIDPSTLDGKQRVLYKIMEDRRTEGQKQRMQAAQEKLKTEQEKKYNELNNQVKQYYQELQQMKDIYSDQLHEIEKFDAELTLVGIPADIPIGAIFPIKPRILESTTDRQSGYYIVKGCSNTISTDGTFVTKVDLFRLRGL